MEERLLIALAVAAAGALVYLVIKLAHRARLARRGPELPKGWRDGLPGVLYFSSEGCAPCEPQARVVEKVGKLWERPVNVVKVDVDRDPELAERWSVLTVPTTLILDVDGKIEEINHGVASERRLRRQLEGVS